MPQLNLHVDGDGCWKDIPQLRQEGRLIDCMGNDAKPIELAALPGGMASGATSVTIRIDLPDGKTVLTETSFKLLKIAVDAIQAKHEPDLAAMKAITEASIVLQRSAQAIEHPLILACHHDQTSDGSFLYSGYSGEVRPDVSGLTIAHRCDASEAQDIIDLLQGYWQKKYDKQKPRGFGK